MFLDVGLRVCKCYDELLSIMLLQIITHQEFIMSDLLMVHMAAGGVRSKSKKNECKCLHAYRGWSYYGYLFNIIPEDHCRPQSHTERGCVAAACWLLRSLFACHLDLTWVLINPLYKMSVISKGTCT